jgi:serine/threonine protein kinase
VTDHMRQQFGNYRLLRRLGQGGFGQVYLGEHVYLKTHAAIKFLLGDVDNAQEEIFYAKFLQEARNIAGLKHPHILRVLEFGVEMSTPYLVMEYAAHGSLLGRHPHGTKVPLDQVVGYTKQIAQALQYAHGVGLIHRDVKPANVLLDERDTVLLGDFGIATIANRTSSMGTSTYAGTASYMAPEQLQGKPVRASDQYALAIMVYEWLCGQLPYQGDPVAVGMQHLMAPIPSLCIHNDALSPGIEAAVHRAMVKNPKERYATVLAFAIALEKAIQSEQGTSTFIKSRNFQGALVLPGSLQARTTQWGPPQHSSPPQPGISAVPFSRSGYVPEPLSAPSQHQTSRGSDSLKTEQSVKTLTQYDWETVVRKIRLGDTPPNWQVHVASAQKLINVLDVIIYFISIIFVIFGIMLLIYSYNSGAIGVLSIALGVFTMFMMIKRTLKHISLKNGFIILLPAGLLQGDLRKAEPTHLIDYVSALDIRARKRSAKVKRLQGNAIKPTITVIGLSAFAEPKELAQSIERAFLRFKTQEPTT